MNDLSLVYIETTIPSFYHEVRTEPAMVARRDATRLWWDHFRDWYRIATSEAVLAELRRGSHPKQSATLALLDDLPLLVITDSVRVTVAAYISNRIMPNDVTGDALHLAVASHHRCSFLLTWNCRHLANANKFDHIAAINSELGLTTPRLITPEQLLPPDAD